MSVSFSLSSELDVGQVTPSRLVSGDFNGDGNLDLVVSSFAYTSIAPLSAFSILLGNGTNNINAFGAPDTVILSQQGGNLQSLATGDFNRDGKLDLLATTSWNNIVVLPGDGTGKFATPISTNIGLLTGTFGGTPSNLTVADFNNDGNLDVAGTTGGSISIFLGDGKGSFKAGDPLLVRGSQNSIASGDFNQDGKIDLISGGFEGSSAIATVFINDGTAKFTAGETLRDPVSSSIDNFGLGDLNQDGKLDVVTTTGVLLGDGTGKLKVATQFSVSAVPGDFYGSSAPSIADFNGDGKLDIIQSGYGGSRDGLYVFLGDGSGGVSQPALIGENIESQLVGDFNKDGKPDLVAVKGEPVKAAFLLVNRTIGKDALVFSSVKTGYNSKSRAFVDASSQTDSTLTVDLSKKTLRLNGGTTLRRSIPGVIDVVGTIQNDSITGNEHENTLRSNAGNDILNGLGGDDRLVGDAGNDQLTGGRGRDRFVFRLEERGVYLPFSRELGVDRILDFERGRDKIALNEDTFTALGQKLSFASVETIAAAKRSRSLITYVQSTGRLYYNENGNQLGFGSGGLFADLENGLNLSAKDCLIAR